MNVTMELTLNGLLRALRSHAHQMADDIESRYSQVGSARPGPRMARREQPKAGTEDDDFTGD